MNNLALDSEVIMFYDRHDPCMVFNTTLKTSNILTLTVTDEGYSRNTALAKDKNK
jgi:hypothetical protein